MLKTRVVTAVVLLAVFLPSLFFLPQRFWTLLTVPVAGIAAWEWGTLIRLERGGRIAYGVAVAALCLAVTLLAPQIVGAETPATPAAAGVMALYGAAALFWSAVVPLWLRYKWQLAGSSLLGALVGVGVVVPTWLALVQLRLLGAGALLAILAVVWIADIAAYFSGRAFGRHKLAPSISPGKTWEGAMGAAVAVVAYGWAVREILQLETVAPGWWLLGLLAVTAASIVGDLFESLLKRQSGMKDSSSILPGHGGVLDRIDSLTSTLPTVALLWLLSLPVPA